MANTGNPTGKSTNGAGAELLPWQAGMVGCDLVLHAPLPLRLEAATVQREYGNLMAEIETGAVPASFSYIDGEWSVLHLIASPPHHEPNQPGQPLPALRKLPSIAGLIADSGWTVLRAHLMRLPPGGILPWHYEPQAPHYRESRLLMPILAPKGAVTLLGHDQAVYPEGQFWLGDFGFPHQVENRSTQDRIVLVVDVLNTPPFLSLAPASLYDRAAQRVDLALRMNNLVLEWRSAA